MLGGHDRNPNMTDARRKPVQTIERADRVKTLLQALNGAFHHRSRQRRARCDFGLDPLARVSDHER